MINSSKHSAPVVTAGALEQAFAIAGGGRRVSYPQTVQRIKGTPVRYTLSVSRSSGSHTFLVEVFSDATKSWNDLWELEPDLYEATYTGTVHEAGRIPVLLASDPDDGPVDWDAIAASWQPLMSLLHEHAVTVLK